MAHPHGSHYLAPHCDEKYPVVMSEKTQFGWNGLGRIVALGGIATGPKPLAGWLVTGLKAFKVSQGTYRLEKALHGLRGARSHLGNHPFWELGRLK